MAAKRKKALISRRDGIIYTSTDTIMFSGWYVKACKSNTGNILLNMFNPESLKVYTRFFTNEYDANLFIGLVVEKGGLED